MTRTAATILCSLLLLPAGAHAQDRCRHSDPRALTLDIGTARTVVFETGNSQLRLEGKAGRSGAVKGRACASSAEHLDQLTLTQERIGDRLVVRAMREPRSGIPPGNGYAYLDLAATVPADVAIELDLGSGDAWVTGTRSLTAAVGSGDLDVRRVAGEVAVKVGSGDVVIDDIGALDVGSIGSGDVTAARVRGGARIGSIGSGDVELAGVGGDARIGSIGSGDAALRDVTGNVVVDSIGSGDLDVRGVRGGLTVRSRGSGSIEYDAVAGAVDLPRRR